MVVCESRGVWGSPSVRFSGTTKDHGLVRECTAVLHVLFMGNIEHMLELAACINVRADMVPEDRHSVLEHGVVCGS